MLTELLYKEEVRSYMWRYFVPSKTLDKGTLSLLKAVTT